jgi:hypothetical protein
MKRQPESSPKRAMEQLFLLGVACCLAAALTAQAQVRPYIGYAYPAGSQQGTTVQIRLGGQGLDDVNEVLMSGAGITGRVVEYYRRLNNQEMQLLNEQLKELKRATTAVATSMMQMMVAEPSMMGSGMATDKASGVAGKDEVTLKLIAKIERRTREFVQTPACASISSLAFVELVVAADAPPGMRELRLATPRGVSNPLVFHVGQVPEVSRKPMVSATLQVLGKEALALRKRPADEAEDRITVPCTVNGQVASGEVNRYRFQARHGQRLVFTTQARQLVPYIADAVPGWFQPVLVLYDAKGKELAYDDDDRFKPDPVILYEVPKDGEYVLAIYDSLYRGREDFVYRITIGELPFLTSLFPLGSQTGASVTPEMKGWNLQEAQLASPPGGAGPGVHWLTANRKGIVSNRLPFVLETLPEVSEEEPNDTTTNAQNVTLPVIVNGRVNPAGDWDVFQFTGRSNEAVVAEVQARRLDSPVDSVLKLTDAAGRLLAFNDDHEDLEAGVNTHHADSYFMATLPADGAYFVHVGDTARQGGEEYAYRLRLSAPQPDFALRVVPSSIGLRGQTPGNVTLYADRKDGFRGPIKVALKDPPPGFTLAPISLAGTQTVARLTIKAGPLATNQVVSLSVVGNAKVGGKEVTREAVAAEDRMQAFLWRHLVPASDLKALVVDPSYVPPARRAARARRPSVVATNAMPATNSPAGTNALLVSNVASPAKIVITTNVTLLTNAVVTTNALGMTNGVTLTNMVVTTNVTISTNLPAAKPKFTKQQIAGRLRELKLLFEEGLLTDDFFEVKVAECDVAQ